MPTFLTVTDGKKHDVRVPKDQTLPRPSDSIQSPAKGYCDESISLQGPLTKSKYSKEHRLIRYYDEERQKTLTFLTNNFRPAATTIAQIYKSR